MKSKSNKQVFKILSKKTYFNKKTKKNTFYSESTINSYIQKFNQVKSLTPDEIYDQYKNNSIPFLSAILLILDDTLTKEVKSNIKEIIEKINLERREISYSNTRIKPLKITVEDIEAKLDDLEPTSQDYLLLKLYLAITLRDNFGNIKIVRRHSPKAKYNYINISKNRFELVLNKYKTFNIYGQRVIPINKELQELILNSLLNEPRKFLITQADGKKYYQGLLASHIKKVFDFSINDIRRAVINELLNQEEHTLADRKDLADQMGNSIVVQDSIYKRIS